jgi:hypothetical protein
MENFKATRDKLVSGFYHAPRSINTADEKFCNNFSVNELQYFLNIRKAMGVSKPRLVKVKR